MAGALIRPQTVSVTTGTNGTCPTPLQQKNLLVQCSSLDDTIKGLLKMMPVGARTATYIPAEAVEQMSLDCAPGGFLRARAAHSGL
jgi:hypothetical protein